MPDLIDRIIDSLRAAPGSDELHEAILDSAFLFEKHRGVPPAGWSAQVIAADISDADARRLKDAVVELIQRGGHGSWALGKAYDPALIPVFVGVLRRELDGDSNELYQAMIALDNLGEGVFGKSGLMSAFHDEDYRALARAYLLQFDKRRED